MLLPVSSSAPIGRARSVIRRMAVTAAAALLLSGCTSSADDPVAADRTPQPEPQTTQPADPAQRLLDSTDDPEACAVSFAGDGIDLAPELRTEGGLFGALPLPKGVDEVFAGWYPTPEDAAEVDDAARVGAADTVACHGQRVTLTAGWLPRDEVAARDVGVPILMYHQFTDRPEGVNDPLRLNWAYVGDFDAHMAYLEEKDYYLPTWEELSAFIDGELALPARSVIVTDDDAHSSWFDLAVPVVNAHRILATSFVITKWRSEPSPSPYVLQRSHTHDMHDPGADGRGRMVNWTAEEIAADLRTSADVLGVAEVVAYPYGHYDERTKQGVAEAGFELGVTIEPGLVRAGADKLALPRVRIDYGMGLDAFVASLG